MLTPFQLAEKTGVTRAYITKLIRKGKLKAISLGGGKIQPRYFLKPSELIKLEDILDRSGYYSKNIYKNKIKKDGKNKSKANEKLS